MNIMLCDPAKKIEIGKPVMIAMNTGMVMVGELRGFDSCGFMLKRPALIQNRPVMKDGKTMMNIVFSLALPDSACNYKTRYIFLDSVSVMSAEEVSEDVAKSYEDFCVQIDEGVFKKTMTEKELVAQEEYFEGLFAPSEIVDGGVFKKTNPSCTCGNKDCSCGAHEG